MKKYLIFLFILSFSSITYSQMAIGEWKAHLSYNDAIQTEPGENNVYVLCADAQKNIINKVTVDTINITSLFSYDTEDSSIHTYDKVNSLSDNDIAYMKYSKPYKTLIIIYKNSNIDLLVNNKDIYNIPDYMNKAMLEDKHINNIYLHNEYAYLATNFGIVILNLKKKEITNSYVLNEKVFNSTILNNKLYAATDKGIYAGLLTNNLQDNKNWELFNPSIFNQLLNFNNNIIGKNASGIYKYESDTNNFIKIKDSNYSYINIYDDKLIAGDEESITIFDDLNSYKTVKIENGINHFSYNKKNDIYWASRENKGLNGYKYDKQTNSLNNTISSIIPNSPRRNTFHYMTFTDNRLLVAGGSLNYAGIIIPGTLMMCENGEWTSFEEEGIEEKTNVEYINLTSIVQDPLNPNHHFATTGGGYKGGLYEFKDKKFVKLYDKNNSPLETLSPTSEDIWTNGLKYDNNNNLWMLNSHTESTIKVLKKDGTWTKFPHPEISKLVTMEYIMFDSRNWVWINSMWNNGDNDLPGFFCFNYNNTLDNTKDDQTKFIRKINNQDGVEIVIGRCYSIAEDKNGVIWIGTDKGPLILNNPSKIFDSNFNCTQIKIPKNDGTSNADFLLINEGIRAICIDGANRKWIGTENSGIYLISEDGLETIHHFTTENSPLLSNNISSIVINPNTGEVFIGTNKGLVSYRSDATEGLETFSEDAHAFPNPVNSDYTGLITITGLIKDSNVKITDTSGNLVFTGISVGGQFTWDGKNRSGKRVASGIYFVLAANKEGKEGITTKIMMIK